MEKVFNFFLTYKKSVIVFFALVTLACAILIPFVSVNYDLTDYLPEDVQSAKAVEIMREEFGTEIPNANIMLYNVTIQEALKYKERISAIDGVRSAEWLDDALGADILKTTPAEFLDESAIIGYIKDNNALIRIVIENGMETAALEGIYELIGEENAVAGNAVNIYTTQGMAVSEVLNALKILLPLIILVLLLSTASWLEPILFLVTIGVAVVINMGTNVIFKEISFISQTVSPILQLAVSLDYAIFLLHSFSKFRYDNDPKEAMLLAMKRAVVTVAASASTTVIGFAALTAMRFGVGADLGLNLVKGIIFSFLTVMILLPALTLACYKLIDKTRHRRLLPSFNKLGAGLMKIRIPMLILTLIIVIPCFLAQRQTDYLYGMEGVTNSTRAGSDTVKIEQVFGKENTLVLLVPKESIEQEIKLCNELSSLPHVMSVESYVTVVGANTPPQFVPDNIRKGFYSDNYARIILHTDTAAEGDEAFSTVQVVLDTAGKYYDSGDSIFVTGESAALYDIKNVVSSDNTVVNLVVILGVFMVLVLAFRSVLTPVFLVFSIEAAIWINLSYAYFAGKSVHFIGYMVLSAVQLGATVDYAILLTNRYDANRKEYEKKEAMRRALGNNVEAIMTSAAILAAAGFTLAATSSNPIISELGTLLGRGTVLSFVMVVCVLPALLTIFDRCKHTVQNRSGAQV